MKAISYSIGPFDATDTSNSHVIKFRWQGAAIQMNRCIIKTNDEAHEIVYDKTVTSMKYEHEIDMSDKSYKLQNGKTYVVYMLVSTDGKTWSEMAASNTFMCLSAPSLQFTNYETKLYASSYTFELSYSQQEGEILESFEVILYDANLTLLKTSGKRYVNSDTELAYTFSELSNDNSYYIRAIGKTVNGFDADTGFLQFAVIIEYPSRFSFIEVTNRPCYGGIRIRTNFVWVNHQLYDKDGNPVDESRASYINLPDDDRAIDLTEDYITYNGGFTFDDDWSFMLVCANIRANEPVLVLESENDPNTQAVLIYREGRNGDAHYSGHFELIVSTAVNGKKWNRVYISNNLPHFDWHAYSKYKTSEAAAKIASNYPDGNAVNQWYGIHIRHLGGLYSVYCELVTKNNK